MTEVTEPLLCDWCGEPFAPDELPLAGYENKPTHRKCRRAALDAQRHDTYSESDYWHWRDEREPFTNWPNGQGTYD